MTFALKDMLFGLVCLWAFTSTMFLIVSNKKRDDWKAEAECLKRDNKQYRDRHEDDMRRESQMSQRAQWAKYYLDGGEAPRR